MLVPLLAVMPFAACGAGERAASVPVLRDSAGISIVENRGAVWAEAERWRVADAPLVDIGVLEGDSRYQLFRVVDATRLSDGRIVVANAGTSELRYYDATGEHLLSAGGSGGGPGEFQQLSWIDAAPNDSVVAYDLQLGRLSTLDATGHFVGSRGMQSDAEAGRLLAVGRFSDGSHLVRAAGPRLGRTLESGFQRFPVTLYHATGPDARLDSLGRFPGSEQYIFVQESGGRISSIQLVRPSYVHRLALAVYGDRFYVGPQDTYEIARYSTSGAPERRIRWTGRDLEMTPELIERYLADRLADAETEEQRREIEQWFRDMEFPETVPAYSDIEVDAYGNLWVEEFRRPGEEANRWLVFNTEGRLLGVVELPVGLEVFEIGADFVLGGWQDELEVEHVQLFELVKATARSTAPPG